MVSADRKRSRPPSHTALARRGAALARRARRLLRSTEALLSTGSAQPYEDECELDVLAAQLDVLAAEITERLATGGGEPQGPGMADLGAAFVELQSFRADLHDHEVHERLDRLQALEAGMAPLRWVRDPHELLSKVCEAVVHSCGFDRAMLSRVEGSTWRPWKSYAVADRAFERAFREWLSATPKIPLDHLLLESEMVRRHEPALVTDPENDPRVYKPLVESSGLKSYVAAPLMPTGRVIGFLHADYEDAIVRELDRDILWAFAEAFGQMFERAVLLRRLRDQREQVHEAMQTVERVLDDLANAEIELAGRGQEQSSPNGERLPVSPLRTASGSRIEALLTPRELEVLALMATGATNSRIAEELVISDGTVKSHVKRILRKLRSANRTEAIARYLRLTSASAPR